MNKYRDSKMFLKRQGARFRLFEYCGRGHKHAQEIDADNPRVKSIKWTVHLVNSKAAGRFFAGILDQDWQVDRVVFDRLIAREAAAAGASVWTRAHLLTVPSWMGKSWLLKTKYAGRALSCSCRLCTRSHGVTNPIGSSLSRPFSVIAIA